MSAGVRCVSRAAAEARDRADTTIVGPARWPGAAEDPDKARNISLDRIPPRLVYKSYLPLGDGRFSRRSLKRSGEWRPAAAARNRRLGKARDPARQAL